MNFWFYLLVFNGGNKLDIEWFLMTYLLAIGENIFVNERNLRFYLGNMQWKLNWKKKFVGCDVYEGQCQLLICNYLKKASSFFMPFIFHSFFDVSWNYIEEKVLAAGCLNMRRSILLIWSLSCTSLGYDFSILCSFVANFVILWI